MRSLNLESLQLNLLQFHALVRADLFLDKCKKTVKKKGEMIKFVSKFRGNRGFN